MTARLTHAVLLALVLAGGLLANHAERAVPVERPFVSVGAIGQEVSLWPGTLVVHGARAARTLDGGLGGEATTTGVWVAVDLSVVGGDQPLTVGAFWLEDLSGRTFDATGRVSGNDPGTAQPGSPIRIEVIFEVPRDALGELRLNASTLVASPMLSAVAVTPFEVRDVDAQALTPRGVELVEPAP